MKGITMIRRYIILAAIAIIITGGIAMRLITFDSGSQYGINVGTDTHYCSVEIPAGISCESAN
jgi:hypothetical protein